MNYQSKIILFQLLIVIICIIGLAILLSMITTMPTLIFIILSTFFILLIFIINRLRRHLNNLVQIVPENVVNILPPVIIYQKYVEETILNKIEDENSISLNV